VPFAWSSLTNRLLPNGERGRSARGPPETGIAIGRPGRRPASFEMPRRANSLAGPRIHWLRALPASSLRDHAQQSEDRVDRFSRRPARRSSLTRDRSAQAPADAARFRRGRDSVIASVPERMVPRHPHGGHRSAGPRRARPLLVSIRSSRFVPRLRRGIGLGKRRKPTAQRQAAVIWRSFTPGPRLTQSANGPRR